MQKARNKTSAGIRQRGPNTYEINFQHKGKRYFNTIYATSERDAFKKRIQMMAQVMEPSHKVQIVNKQASLEEAFNRYLELNERVLDENTLKRAECVFKHLTTFLQRSCPEIINAHQLSLSVCRRFKDYLVSKPAKSLSGVNADIDRIRAIFNKFVEYEFVDSNPFKAVEKFPRKLARPKQKHLPTDVEVRKIIKSAQSDPSYSEITRYIYRTGRRIQETCLLEKRDVNFDANGKPESVKIRPEITKTKEPGLLPLDEDLSQIISEALQKNPHIPYLFTNVYKRGIAPNTFRIFLEGVCKKEKIAARISPHCFRFYAVTRLLNNGVNPKDAMTITGHSDLETFMSYARTTKEGVLSALQKTKLE